jgi:hypothetical protein
MEIEKYRIYMAPIRIEESKQNKTNQKHLKYKVNAIKENVHILRHFIPDYA